MPGVTVVGAGVAGLTLAHQLARQGWDVTVLEAHHEVGGLGRSWHYGEFHFDVGPHRFHTENPRVAAFVSDVLGSVDCHGDHGGRHAAPGRVRIPAARHADLPRGRR